ncbi:hypothetical protein ACS0PU_006200 [Formica fusca]
MLDLLYLSNAEEHSLEHREKERERESQVPIRDSTRENWGVERVNSDELQGCPKPHVSTAIGTNSTTVPGAQFRWIRRYCRWHCNWLPNESPISPKSSEVTPCGIGYDVSFDLRKRRCSRCPWREGK